MVGGSVSASTSGAGIEGLKADMLKLLAMDVLIGIPEDKTVRKNADQPTNAQILYTNTQGSALQHLPARPVLEPAIAAHQKEISELLATAAAFILNGNPVAAKAALKKAGLYGQNAARAWFDDPRNGWAPNAPSTIAAKIRKTPGKLGRDIRAFLDAGGSLDDIQGLEGMTQVLIDTGQMRKAIIWVLRDKEGNDIK